MNRKSNHLTVKIGVLLLALGSIAQAQTYDIQPISPPQGTASCVAEALNNSGQVVGSTTIQVGNAKKTTSVAGPAFLWESGQSFALPPLDGNQSADAHGISDTGVAVGISYSVIGGSRTNVRPTRWIRNIDGSFLAIDCSSLLPSGSDWEPWAISEDGRFIEFESATGTFLIELDEAGNAVANPLGNNIAIWDLRVAAGNLKITGAANDRAFLWLWSSDQFIDLHPNLPGTSFGTAVNALNQVAGVYRVNGANRPAYWNESGQYLDIFAGKATGGYALGINDAGSVVGWATLSKPGPTSIVFLWRPLTGAKDLNLLKSPRDTSGVSLNWAGSINSTGQILARGSTRTVSSQYVLLKPQ